MPINEKRSLTNFLIGKKSANCVIAYFDDYTKKGFYNYVFKKHKLHFVELLTFYAMAF
jgi:hypothetical protein